MADALNSFSVVPSRAAAQRLAATAPAPHDTPTGEWLVPVEMALRCSTSALVEAVRARRSTGDLPERGARVFQSAGCYFATVTFGGGRSVFLPLDLWAWGDWR